MGHRQDVVTALSLSLQVGLVALGFAWKRRDDESFFTESLQEATEGLGTGLAGLSCTHASHALCCSRPRGPGVVERVRMGLGPAGSLSIELAVASACVSESHSESKFGCTFRDLWGVLVLELPYLRPNPERARPRENQLILH